jgi:hypothetical protein
MREPGRLTCLSAVSDFSEITNDELRRDHLPSQSDDQLVWISFALKFDGYSEKGGFDQCAAFAEKTRTRWESSGALPSDLSDLRAALYFEQRRWRWSEEEPFTEGEWRYWHALVDAIRERLHA